MKCLIFSDLLILSCVAPAPVFIVIDNFTSYPCLLTTSIITIMIIVIRYCTGIANNSFLAKIGADQNKPDGQFSLSPSREAVLEFLDDLPCRKIPGINIHHPSPPCRLALCLDYVSAE